MGVDANKTLNITSNGAYTIIRPGGGRDSTVYVYGTIGGATLELHGPGGLLEDGAITSLPFQKVVRHGGKLIQLVVTGAAGTDINVQVG